MTITKYANTPEYSPCHPQKTQAQSQNPFDSYLRTSLENAQHFVDNMVEFCSVNDIDRRSTATVVAAKKKQ